MPLNNYGLLTGKLIDHGVQHGGNPHYLLLIQAGVIRYHVALNVESTRPHGDAPAALQYQTRDDLGRSKLAKGIANRNAFVLHDGDQSRPSLDFIRDGVIDIKAFKTLKPGLSPQANPFYKGLVQVAGKAKTDAGAFVAVFGTGYPDQDDRPRGRGHNPLRASAGFTGIDNVHMNQGSPYRVGHHTDPSFAENGTHQDGAVLFFFSDKSVVGFFAKFESQDTQTDDFGNPLHIGVAKLDALKATPAVATQLQKQRPNAKKLLAGAKAPAGARRRRGSPPGAPAGAAAGAGAGAGPGTPGPSGPDVPVSGTSGGQEAPALGFADTTTIIDPNRPFAADNDDQFFNSPFVNNFAKFGTPEPVPGPRNGVYPVLKLEDVIGAAAAAAIKANKKIAFHAVGDTGPVVQSQYGKEQGVAELMVKDFAPTVAAAEMPSFFFHLGDVVYYYGEQEFYYDQFYHPYKEYPRPILAIPGNHDGITHPNGASSLQGFISAFCDDKPRYWKEAAGIRRTTMIQPGVYFTLDAPFVSIVGLYSNCDETFGYIDDQQKVFLLSELKRLKPLRQSGAVTAVLLAVHHCPMSFSVSKPASTKMRADIDAACQQANFWPDAVFSGHAHIYQRMARLVPVGGKTWQIPHFIAGSGGYANKANQEVNKKDMATQDVSDPQFRLHNFMLGYGYLRATVTPGSPAMLRVEFRSPDHNDGLPADTCVLNLDTHQIM
jgi:uncharacterized protein YukJ